MVSIKEKIDSEKLPQHVAVIMDGNGRWAKSRDQERTFGHKNAIKAVREVINACKCFDGFIVIYAASRSRRNFL